MVLQVSHDMKVVLAIISVVTSTIGIFFGAIIFGPPAIICSVITLFTPTSETKLETRFKIIAGCGLYLGSWEFIFWMLVLLGVISF